MLRDVASSTPNVVIPVESIVQLAEWNDVVLMVAIPLIGTGSSGMRIVLNVGNGQGDQLISQLRNVQGDSRS